MLVIILGSFLRFYLIKDVPPGLYPDEAMNGNNALEALATGKFKVFYPENNGREGLFINLQAISLKIFGNEPWALRMVSALFGTLTILGLYLVTKELFSTLSPKPEISNSKPQIIALLSSFFLATSYWHLNFSRIGFRAILLPFFATFGLYFLLKGLREGKTLNLVWAGIFTGLGFYSYIAFRFVPFILAVPITWYLWQWHKDKISKCIPCLAALFILITLAVALPIGFYFFQNPQDFIGRSGQVSIFSAASPVKEFLKSNLATLGMFFIRGDCNWRHNYACQPELHYLVSLFFLIGILITVKNIFKPQTLNKITSLTLVGWFFFMTLPATLTREGLPHALRSIGLIPPAMIFAGLGAYGIIEKILEWFEKQKQKWPQKQGQIDRIKKELSLLFILVLLFIPLTAYRVYFIYWGSNANTFFGFSSDLLHAGKFLNDLPKEIKKYVMVNLDGVDIRGFPAPAQTIMFATDTFREENRFQKNFTYLTRENWTKNLPVLKDQKVIILFLDGNDRQLMYKIQKQFTGFKLKVPGDFVVLQNW